MKKILLLSPIILLSFAACKKKDEVKRMDYSISGLADTSYTYQKVSIPFSVHYVSGNKENVSLGIEGLPKSLDASFSTASGTPDFNTALELIHNDYLAAGTYTLKVNANAGSDNARSADINLVVKGSCGDYLAGKYNTDITYAATGEAFSNAQYTLAVKPEDGNRIYFYADNNPDPDFYADFDCSAGTVSVPTQSKPGGTFTYSGTGKVITKNRDIEMTIRYEGFTELKFVLHKQ